MGNPDIVIIINGIAYIVNGSDYDEYNIAVQIAIDKHIAKYKSFLQEFYDDTEGRLFEDDADETFEEMLNIKELRSYSL